MLLAHQIDGNENCLLVFLRIQAVELSEEEIQIIERPIGEGNFATVYKGVVRGTIVAVKKFRCLTIPQQELISIGREVDIGK